MKLRLKNFRCYQEDQKEFDFGENGLLLLSGQSGCGKTTLLQAIMFALYGTGNKLVTYGKTSCKVELDFDDLHITRTKRPNRLVLNSAVGEFEDDAAQEIINKKFGKTFDVTGYISQNATNSFVLMSPMDKLGFLERFAFADIDLTQLKHKCKEVIKQRNEKLIAVTSQFELASRFLIETKKPEEVVFPLKHGKNAESRERAISNEITRLKNTETLLTKTLRSLTKHKEEEAALNVLSAKTTTKTQALNGTIEKIGELTLDRENIEYSGDDVLKKYEEQLVAVISRRELCSLETRYEEDVKRLEEMKQTERKETEDKIKEILNGLWKEYTEEEIKTTTTEYKQLLKDAKQLLSLEESLRGIGDVNEEQLKKDKTDLEKYKTKLEAKKDLLSKLKLQQETYTCPSCEASLRFQNDELKVSESVDVDTSDLDISTLNTEIKTLSNRICRLEGDIPQQQNRIDRRNEINLRVKGIKDSYDEPLPTVTDIEDDLESLQDYRKTQLELEKHKKELETSLKDGKLSSAVTSFDESLKKQKKKIKHLQEKSILKEDVDDLDEVELRVKIQTQKRNKEKLEDIEKRLSLLAREKAGYQDELSHDKEEHIKKYEKIRKIEKIKKVISKRTEELKTLEEKKEKYTQNVKEVEKYQAYLVELEKYQEWLNKVEDLKREEEDGRKKYAAAVMLKEKIVEAESIAMINIINSINSHVQEYLDIFFADNPISARLLPFKETKTSNKASKPQINIQIEYKGMEADLSMLSGGELSRVNLAYTLALGEIFNTPLMLLDECTASLDQELTSVVIEGIKENYAGKMVIVVAHQVVQGLAFDRVIEV